MDAPAALRVMSFNIRGAVHPDGANAWPARAALNVATIRRHAPDLIGFQEAQQGNLETYRAALPEYQIRQGPRYDNAEPHGYAAIAWRPERLAIAASGGCWLSRTPERFSADWDTACVRVAHWASFRPAAGGAEFLHLNTHLDHVSEPARVEGAALILRQLAGLAPADLPVIITGDFNCRPGSPAYRLFTDAGFADAHLAAGGSDRGIHTFHGFKGAGFVPWDDGGPGRIDWVLTRGLAARSCAIGRDEAPPLYPSDHYPIVAELTPGA